MVIFSGDTEIFTLGVRHSAASRREEQFATAFELIPRDHRAAHCLDPAQGRLERRLKICGAMVFYSRSTWGVHHGYVKIKLSGSSLNRARWGPDFHTAVSENVQV